AGEREDGAVPETHPAQLPSALRGPDLHRLRSAQIDAGGVPALRLPIAREAEEGASRDGVTENAGIGVGRSIGGLEREGADRRAGLRGELRREVIERVGERELTEGRDGIEVQAVRPRYDEDAGVAHRAAVVRAGGGLAQRVEQAWAVSKVVRNDAGDR